MIKITFQVIPFGVFHPKTLGEIEIVNTGEGTSEVADYKYKLSYNNKTLSDGKISNFKRNEYNVFYLLYLILRNVYG